MHALLVELALGGISRKVNVSNASAFVADITAATAVEQIRNDLANDLLGHIRFTDLVASWHFLGDRRVFCAMVSR